MKSLFDILDKDQSGGINSLELLKLLKTIDGSITEIEAEYVYSSIKGKDNMRNSINFNEFENIFNLTVSFE